MGLHLTLPQALTHRAELRAAGKKLVLTNGVFDLLHVGHLDYLEKARALGDFLLVGVNSDEITRQLKGPDRPWTPAVERARLLAALAPVDAVVIFDSPTAIDLVRAVAPDIYAKGGDYATKFLPEAETAHAVGAQIALIDYLPGHSTSEVIKRIRGLHHV